MTAGPGRPGAVPPDHQPASAKSVGTSSVPSGFSPNLTTGAPRTPPSSPPAASRAGSRGPRRPAVPPNPVWIPPLGVAPGGLLDGGGSCVGGGVVEGEGAGPATTWVEMVRELLDSSGSVSGATW